MTTRPEVIDLLIEARWIAAVDPDVVHRNHAVAVNQGRILAILPLDQLHDSPYQPRTHYSGLEGLADSIRADGVLQPLMVRPRHPKADEAAQEAFKKVPGPREGGAASRSPRQAAGDLVPG